MVNNVLHRTWLDADRIIKCLQVIVPFKLKEAFIIACHLGPRKTAHQVQRCAYFQGWRSKSYRICRQCTACASRFRDKIKHQACMQPMLTALTMEKIRINLCGPISKSYDNKVYILPAQTTLVNGPNAFLYMTSRRTRSLKLCWTTLSLTWVVYEKSCPTNFQNSIMLC
jgi:Integrase zinc binding domain